MPAESFRQAAHSIYKVRVREPRHDLGGLTALVLYGFADGDGEMFVLLPHSVWVSLPARY